MSVMAISRESQDSAGAGRAVPGRALRAATDADTGTDPATLASVVATALLVLAVVVSSLTLAAVLAVLTLDTAGTGAALVGCAGLALIVLGTVIAARSRTF